MCLVDAFIWNSHRTDWFFIVILTEKSTYVQAHIHRRYCKFKISLWKRTRCIQNIISFTISHIILWVKQKLEKYFLYIIPIYLYILYSRVLCAIIQVIPLIPLTYALIHYFFLLSVFFFWRTADCFRKLKQSMQLFLPN